jgi:mycofactocin precursor
MDEPGLIHSFIDLKKDGTQMDDTPKSENTDTVNSPPDDSEEIFNTEEVEIEEMAIDGICGVY